MVVSTDAELIGKAGSSTFFTATHLSLLRVLSCVLFQQHSPIWGTLGPQRVQHIHTARAHEQSPTGRKAAKEVRHLVPACEHLMRHKACAIGGEEIKCAIVISLTISNVSNVQNVWNAPEGDVYFLVTSSVHCHPCSDSRWTTILLKSTSVDLDQLKQPIE